MRTVPMMAMRRHLGEMLDEVRLKHEILIIERAGRPMARLCPLLDEATDADRRDVGLRMIDRMAAMGGRTRRGKDVERWMDAERSAWDERK